MKSERYNKTQHNAPDSQKKKKKEKGQGVSTRGETRQSVRGENKACRIEIAIEMM